MKTLTLSYLLGFFMIALIVMASPHEESEAEQYQDYYEEVNPTGVSFKEHAERQCTNPSNVCLHVHTQTDEDATKYDIKTLNGGTVGCNTTYIQGTGSTSVRAFTGSCVGKAPLEILMTCTRGDGGVPEPDKLGWVYANFQKDGTVTYQIHNEAAARFGTDGSNTDLNKRPWTVQGSSTKDTQIDFWCPFISQQ